MHNIDSEKPVRLMSRTASKLLGCLLVSAILAGCSSVKTQVDKGPLKARAFSFLNTGDQPPSYAEERKNAHAMVQQALVNNLAAKGVAYRPSGGDVTVAYLIVVGNNAMTTALNEHYGYTPDSDAFVEKVHSEQARNDTRRDHFEAGTLVIDFIDPATSKLLQRRSIQAQVLRNLPSETRATRVQAAVDQALKDLPISH